jgi:PAS domain S-box-containing protein
MLFACRLGFDGMHDTSVAGWSRLSHSDGVSPQTSKLVASKDWAQTPLGPVASWPQALRLSVDLILASGFPMAVRWGPHLTMIYNDGYAPILGDKHPNALGRPLRDVWPEIYHQLGPISEGILRGERGAFFARNHLWRIHRREGDWENARFTISYSPIPDPTAENGIGGVLTTAMEITTQVESEEELRRLSGRLELEVTERTRERDRIWLVSEDLLGESNFEGYFLSVNPAWTALLGWSEAEIKRMHVSELRHPDDAASSDAGRRLLASGTPRVRIENRFRHKDGSWRWLAWTLTVEGGLIYLIGRHITADKEMAEQLRESERHFRLFVNGVTDYALFRLDPHGTICSWNSGAQRIKGYTGDEIIDRHISTFYTPEDKSAGVPARALRIAAEQGRYEGEGWRVRKNGERFWANVVIDAIHDETGALIGFAKITRDITERREAQLALQRTQDQLAQSQKMDALGQLTGGIAHDFNNMLMVIAGYTEFLKRSVKTPQEIRAMEAIEAATTRAENLTRQLLTFSRRQPLNPATVKPGELFESFKDILASSARGNIALDLDIQPGVWPILIDQNEFEVALVNLVVNARDAMPSGGTIRISAYNVTLGENDAVDHLAGDFVRVEIADTGSGIPPDIIQRVFDPFFTTKETDRGTGLGLSQVYGFAHQAGGTVKLASKVGGGTTVSLYLPRSRAAVTEATRETAGNLPAGHEIVLLVEDNPEVKAVTAAMLDQLGYRIVEADCAHRALDVLASGEPVDLVLSDVVMPGSLDGVALGKQVRERYPQLPVLLMTGYAKQAKDTPMGFPVLRKPFQIAALGHAVRGALESRQTVAAR